MVSYLVRVVLPLVLLHFQSKYSSFNINKHETQTVLNYNNHHKSNKNITKNPTMNIQNMKKEWFLTWSGLSFPSSSFIFSQNIHHSLSINMNPKQYCFMKIIKNATKTSQTTKQWTFKTWKENDFWPGQGCPSPRSPSFPVKIFTIHYQ